MIEETEVKYVISEAVPELAIDLSMIKVDNDLYKSVECLTDYTKEVIRSERLNEVRQSFLTAYELLQQGSFVVKLAIINIYVNSVSRIVESTMSEQSIRTEFMKKFGKEYNEIIYTHAI
jgi:hypothetical protein